MVNALIVLRDGAVVAERVRLDRRVELDGALQDAELDVQLLGGVVADEAARRCACPWGSCR